LPVDVQHIATLAISAIRDIAVAIAGSEIETAVDTGTNAPQATTTETSSAEPVRRRGRPPKNANGAVPVETTPEPQPVVEAVAEPVVEPTPEPELAPEPESEPEPEPVVAQEPEPQPVINGIMSLDDLFGGDDTVTESKSPKVLREEIGTMIVTVLPRLGSQADARTKLVQMLGKYGAKAPKDLTEDSLPGMHADLTALVKQTDNPGARVGT
jgi:predicted component of type VI protein secretion system